MDRDEVARLIERLRQDGCVDRALCKEAAAALEALLPTPPADVKALIERVRSALAAHHDWHLQAGEMAIAKDENGQPIWLDLGLEYQDSSLYERTADAMTALASLGTGWRPTREQIAQIIEPLSWHAIGSHGISTHDARRALSLRKADAILALTPEAE